MNQHNTKEAQGTSLEVLAPYLPYGIEVETGMGPSRIISVDLLRDGPEVETCTTEDWVNGEINGTDYYHFSQITPILRPFEALVQPLKDGTVPLYEYVRFMWPKETTMRHRAYGDYIEVHGSTALYLAKREDFEAGRMHGLGTAYLRRHHFAVGLQPHQYIAK